MKRLKQVTALLGTLFCIYSFVALCGSISTEKTHDTLHEASSRSSVFYQLIPESGFFSFDSEFREDDNFSSSFALIDFGSEIQAPAVSSVNTPCISVGFTKKTNIPLYLLYHSLKTPLS